MKSILLSIKPKWLAKILNGDKTIEVRKLFPKDYKGWVYIYCTKSQIKEAREYFTFEELPRLGKVIARFYCDKVEEIKLPYTKFGTNEWVGCEEERTLQTQTMNEKTLLEKSCLKENEIYGYLNFKNSPNNVGYAIHISALEIFDKPKELSEFKTYKTYNFKDLHNCRLSLTKAPQNFVYIEIEKNEPNNI